MTSEPRNKTSSIRDIAVSAIEKGKAYAAKHESKIREEAKKLKIPSFLVNAGFSLVKNVSSNTIADAGEAALQVADTIASKGAASEQYKKAKATVWNSIKTLLKPAKKVDLSDPNAPSILQGDPKTVAFYEGINALGDMATAVQIGAMSAPKTVFEPKSPIEQFLASPDNLRGTSNSVLSLAEQLEQLATQSNTNRKNMHTANHSTAHTRAHAHHVERENRSATTLPLLSTDENNHRKPLRPD
jgi:hypothetical protein